MAQTVARQKAATCRKPVYAEPLSVISGWYTLRMSAMIST
jgi:hypothetical protein